MYDMKKKAEVFYKAMVLGKEKEGISAAPPHFYCERFISKIKAITRLGMFACLCTAVVVPHMRTRQ